MDMPETRYARSGDLHIAYQVVGSGALDLVVVHGAFTNLELLWEIPRSAHFHKRLASFSRLILFDKRGMGLSDRIAGAATLEERMDDVRAVMDAVGSERAAIFGSSEGGAMSMLFAATYPERTRALVLYGTFARYAGWVFLPDQLEEIIAGIERSHGTGESLRRYAPSLAADKTAVRAWGRFERLSASPQAMIALRRMNAEIDIRHVLPAIRVPTLVLHRSGDTAISVEAGRSIAAQIPGARYVELPGADHLPTAGDSDRLTDEIEEFLTGSRHEVEPDRVLATVLFTDIAGSTERVVELGDRAWRQVLGRHDEMARQEIARFRGRAVKSLGDGFLATFDGPARAVRCAAAIAERVRPLGIAVRSGLHTGEIELIGEDVGGVAVHIAQRVSGLAGSGEVLVSSTVRDLVAGSGLSFTDRGSHALKGLPEELRLFAAAV
ncbi:MAG: adenylate/guanylate cyclase domain-containing protein [Stellaceae bacterium]